jgi:hypothetical protein
MSYQTELRSLDAAMLWRDGPGLVWFGGRVWMVGGWNPVEGPAYWGGGDPDIILTNEVLCSTNYGRTWAKELRHVQSPPSSGAGARFNPRHTHWLGVHTYQATDYLMVIGGDHVSLVQDAWRSTDPGNPDGWERICASLPTAAQSFQWVGEYHGDLYLGGGQSDWEDPTTALQTFYRSTDGGATWTQLGDVPFAGRGMIYHPCEFQDRLVVAGGGTFHASAGLRTVYHDVWAFDNADDSWTQYPDAGWEGCEYHNTLVWDSKLWKFNGFLPRLGGAPDGNVADAWYLETLGGSWTQVQSVPWPPGHADGFCATNHGVIQALGNGGQWNGWHASTYRLYADGDEMPCNACGV